jgi:alanine dehydrogenase
VAGIPPPTVVVLGAGAAGQAAAKLSLASGAHAIILDSDINQLREAHESLGARATTAVSSERNLTRFTAVADVLIGAVLTPGARAPFVVTEAMVNGMKPGSVIIDLSIDQGGCIETSRPTSLEDPAFKVHGVTHCCVPNMTAGVPRTASRAMTIAALPYVMRVVQQGLDQALASSEGLARGVYMYRGRLVNEHVARVMGEPPVSLERILPRADR